jgi:hypothetical protein
MEKIISWLNPRGTKTWLFILGIVLGAAWAFAFLALVDYLMQLYAEQMTGVDTTLMLGIFIGMVTIAFILTIIAKDKRGMTYGLYSGLACMVVCGLILFRDSLTLVPVVGFMGPLGAFNGAGLGEMFNLGREARKKERDS